MFVRGKVIVVIGKKDEEKLILKEVKDLETWKKQKGIADD